MPTLTRNEEQPQRCPRWLLGLRWLLVGLALLLVLLIGSAARGCDVTVGSFRYFAGYRSYTSDRARYSRRDGRVPHPAGLPHIGPVEEWYLSRDGYYWSLWRNGDPPTTPPPAPDPGVSRLPDAHPDLR